jgi:hypothetical protein
MKEAARCWVYAVEVAWTECVRCGAPGPGAQYSGAIRALQGLCCRAIRSDRGGHVIGCFENAHRTRDGG